MSSMDRCFQSLKSPISPSRTGLFTPIPENLARHKARAKYVPAPDGSLRLAMVQVSTQPIFLPSGLEVRKDSHRSDRVFADAALPAVPEEDAAPALPSDENLKRASRRARIRAMDFILCNPDMDTFGSLTFDPDQVQRDSWEKTYGAARVWLSNRVQRNDLKYVMVPEYHADGKCIHFHAVMNSAALDMIEARYPNSGRLIKKRRAGECKQLYNLTGWKGFSSLEQITGDGSRDKVAKYIFKYMGKQLGQRIGGRYFLHGGNMASPVYRYGETVEEFLHGEAETNRFSVDVTQNIVYTEVSYL